VPLRVLLLARTAGFWWEALGQRLDADYEIPATATVLPPLGGEVSRMELFTIAFDHFAAAKAITSFGGQARDAERPPAGLGGRGFGQVLTVHMAALAAVDAYWRGEAAPADPARISAYLLTRERGHWKEWNGSAEDPLPTGPEIMGHVVYAATLTGPLSHAEGIEALARAKVASVVENASQILTDHRKCYPPENPATVLEPLYPDRLGEDFIALTTPRHHPGTAPTAAGSDDLAALADGWADTAVGGLLLPTAGQRPAGWTAPALTVLIETARRWPHIAEGHLYPLLRAHPHLVLQAGGAALTSLAALPGVDFTVLEAIEARLSPDRHIDLDTGIAALATRLADHRLGMSNDPAEDALIYNNLGYRLQHAGLHQQALAAAHNATQIWQQLAAADRAAYVPGLALSLNNEAMILGEVGRRADAVPVSQQAVNLRRELAELNRDTYLPDLALSLANHAMRLQEVGRLADALDISQEAVDPYRKLAEATRAAHLPGLARALNTRSAILAEAELAPGALATSQEAVDLYRNLAGTSPDTYLPDLAMAFTNHAMRLLEVARRADAVPFSHEAVALFRELTDRNRAAHLPSLAMALSHAARLAEPGQPADALEASEEAVALFRELTDLNPAAHLHALGMALNNRATLRAGAAMQSCCPSNP
jgi:tetratricopeptide (TPR) repeat protein